MVATHGRSAVDNAAWEEGLGALQQVTHILVAEFNLWAFLRAQAYLRRDLQAFDTQWDRIRACVDLPAHHAQHGFTIRAKLLASTGGGCCAMHPFMLLSCCCPMLTVVRPFQGVPQLMYWNRWLHKAFRPTTW